MTLPPFLVLVVLVFGGPRHALSIEAPQQQRVIVSEAASVGQQDATAAVVRRAGPKPQVLRAYIGPSAQVSLADDGGPNIEAPSQRYASYSYYRFRVPAESANQHHLCINEMEFYFDDHQVPTRAVKCGEPPCTFASSISEAKGPQQSWEPQNAFDGDNKHIRGVGWCAKRHPGNHYGSGDGWLAYMFPEKKNVDMVKIYFWDKDHSADEGAVFEGSDDGMSWDILNRFHRGGYDFIQEYISGQVQPEQVISSEERRQIDPAAFTHYRFRVPPSSANHFRLCITEMRLYDADATLLMTPAKNCGQPPCAYASSVSGADSTPELAFDNQNFGTGGAAWCAEPDTGNRKGTGDGWLAYQFPIKKLVGEVEIWFWRADHSALGEATFEASNDGEHWYLLRRFHHKEYEKLKSMIGLPRDLHEVVDIEESRSALQALKPPSFKCYRYKVPPESGNRNRLCINEMEFFRGGEQIKAIGKLCGNPRDPPCALASSTSPLGAGVASLAFDNLNLKTGGQGFCAAKDEVNADRPGHGWLAYDFSAPTTVDRIRVFFWGENHSSAGPATLEGSMDCHTWTVLAQVRDANYKFLDVDLNPATQDKHEAAKESAAAASKAHVDEKWPYIRYNVPPDSANTQALCINEMEFFYKGRKVNTRALTCGQPPCAYGTEPLGAQWMADQAFDGLNLETGGQGYCATKNTSNAHGPGMGFLGYHFADEEAIDEVRLYFFSDRHSASGPATIDGSKDGMTWIELSRIVNRSYDYIAVVLHSPTAMQELQHRDLTA